MGDKNTDELERALKTTHPEDYDRFRDSNKDSFLMDKGSFSEYIKGILNKNRILLQTVFLEADIPERYGYKLLSEEKHTKQRDVILRICYAGRLTLDETQRALKIYKMAELYAKDERDALIMICFNERPGTILDVNTYLKEYGMQPLRSSGLQD